MRIKDALATFQFGQAKKEDDQIRELSTVWSPDLKAAEGTQQIPRNEYPRPQLQRSEWICLNGIWDYAIRKEDRDLYEKGAPEGFLPDGRILVPFSPETRASGVMRLVEPDDCLWYRRELTVGTIPEGKRLLLHFGAVDQKCRIFWNGHFAGEHRNGYLAFTLDVTEFLQEGKNTIQVLVQDETDRGAECRGKQTLEPGGMYYSPQSGIWQPVWAEWVPQRYIESIRVFPDIAIGTVRVDVRMAGGHEPAGHDKADETPALCIGHPTTEFDAGSVGLFSAVIATVSGDNTETGEGNISFKVTIPEAELWSPERPALYPMTLRIGEDTVTSYFAMREFGICEMPDGMRRLTLNGTPYFFHGVLDQGYWPEGLMTAPSDEAFIYDIRQMKKIGFNMIRKHIKIEAMRWYYHCDRLGIVVWQDMVNGGRVNKLLCTYLPTGLPWLGDHLDDHRYGVLCRMDKEERDRWEDDLMDMIRQLENVPSIGAWVPFNEGWGQFDAVRIAEKVKACDPGRIVDHASGWFDQKGGDLRSIHNYFRKLAVEKEDRPCVLSEYGGDSCQIPGHTMKSRVYGYHALAPEEVSEAFQRRMEEIRRLEKEGLSAAVWTQLSDIEEEVNGLLTYDRKVCKVALTEP